MFASVSGLSVPFHRSIYLSASQRHAISMAMAFAVSFDVGK